MYLKYWTGHDHKCFKSKDMAVVFDYSENNKSPKDFSKPSTSYFPCADMYNYFNRSSWCNRP